MAKILGIEGLTGSELQKEIERGGKFVLFPYCVSAFIITFRRSSDIYFIRSGEAALAKGWPFALISFFLGWWGFPWGLIWTPIALFQTLAGGKNVTYEVLGSLQAASQAASGPQNSVDLGPQNPWANP